MARGGSSSAGQGRLNIECFTNQDYRVQFIVQDQDGTKYGFSGWSAAMQIRESLGDTGVPPVSITSASATANGSIITFDTSEDGLCEVYIAEDDLDNLTIPSGSTQKQYVYDIVFTDTAGDQAPLVGGNFTIIEGVTE